MSITRRSAILALPLLLLLFLTSCASISQGPRAWKDPSGERGLASWYGHPYHGRRTSNGEVYDMYQLSAAHREIPLGSWVEVINLTNGRSLTVRVNDRGPFVDGRIIDLSYASAMLLGVVGPGVAPVRVRLTQAPLQAPGPARYSVQVASFVAESNALALKTELEQKVSGVYLMKAAIDGEVYYRVRVGQFVSHAEAKTAAERLASLGYRVLIMGFEDRL
ncbi:RlpA-like protein precursor [Candidatus Methylomirabilis lanthanidiphila]|uniref:Probable endolytic peptidoglycan transglycosylase RlpA n=1 Tax=Candidatus Methylomirabilis lanthanidiphila TaxID=2211376 RepID=A0A564ZIK3_9BACT|nr:septal ring lytic transglycosylase RlpA family protein [Candidatus Methylomirabilis lanthanidiphila]VUZ85171.1 RlpA-like protein precursor [Candidatus Methylomirabilis lanthanidiphila]